MNAPAAVNNREHFGKHGTAPPCRTETLRQGALVYAIFMVRVRTLRSCPFLKSRPFQSSLKPASEGGRGAFAIVLYQLLGNEKIRNHRLLPITNAPPRWGQSWRKEGITGQELSRDILSIQVTLPDILSPSGKNL
jgi:hypothetical protein